MDRDEGDFYFLGQMIGAYLHQDMDLIAETVPEAIAEYARHASDATKAKLEAELDLFLARHHNDAEAEFKRRYGFDFTPEELGQTVPEFFAMTKEILSDPSNWRRFDAGRGADA